MFLQRRKKCSCSKNTNSSKKSHLITTEFKIFYFGKNIKTPKLFSYNSSHQWLEENVVEIETMAGVGVWRE